MPKKYIVSAIVIILIIVIASQTVFKKEEQTFDLAEAVKGTVSQEVSETGQVQKGNKINLSFKNAGQIERIYVKVGEVVKRGDILAKLDTANFQIQLQEAKAALTLAQAQLDKLLAGATQEEIKVAQTEVQNKQISLNTAQQNLQDAYEDSLNVLSDAYLKAYNAQNTVASAQRTYFMGGDQEAIQVRENKEEIERTVAGIKSSLDQVQANPIQENIDPALPQIKNKLSVISNSLRIIREVCETPPYRSVVSSTDKTSLDTQRTNINTAITNITNAQQTIVSAKLSVETAEGNLQAAKDNLALTTASPRQEDINYYQAKVDQAQAQVQALENQLQDTYLKSPVAGQIAGIKKKVGEMVQPVLQDIVVTLLPTDPFEIKVDIYEEDVVKINVDNPVDISLVAFPEEVFTGRVVSIDPAEKLVEGVVYYEVIIAFDETPEGLKSGMTADLIIKTVSKENVLIVPEDAIQKKNGKTIVEIFEDGNIEEREVEIGLEGSNDMVEIISGLKEGEKVILR